ncbi:MAG: ABC transporter ATP-binding protein [Alphaproteobacteria bacterium]|nr:ABC transporter ATP-binding protein [Alphaproteobacteria bacterium]
MMATNGIRCWRHQPCRSRRQGTSKLEAAGSHVGAPLNRPLLSVCGLHVEAVRAGGRLPIIRGLDIEVAPAETLCLVGESGCGKTMTALAVMGLLPAALQRRAAQLRLDDVDLSTLPEHRLSALRGDRLAMIFQDPNTALNPVYTIGRQLAEVWRRHRDGGQGAAEQRATELLQRVGIAGAVQRLRQYPHQLSGGLRQRVMIAMALMCQPRLLVADEPTTALDVTVQAQVLQLLRDLQSELSLGMLLITHDIGVVAAMANRVAVMYAGEVVEAGPVQAVLRRPRHPYTRGLLDCLPRGGAHSSRLGTIPGSVAAPGEEGGGCAFVNRCGYADSACRAAPVPLSELEAGRSVRCRKPLPDGGVAPNSGAAMAAATPRTEDGPRALETRQVVRHFTFGWRLPGGRPVLRAVRGVSLHLKRGEVLAIVGESGCGKSTLARMLLGLLPPTAGDVLLDGRPIGELGRSAIAEFVQPVFQDPYASLAPHRRIVDTVALPLTALGRGTPAERRQQALRMLAEVGLPEHLADRLPSRLSGGQRQRVAIARALVLRPPVLVCDEPTSALDVSVQAQILNLLVDLKERLNLSLVLITHNIGVVEQLADRVAVMYLGQVVEEGLVAQVLRRPRHHYTRLLLSSALDPGAVGGGLAATAGDSNYPDPMNLPTGCTFHPRCQAASALCGQQEPPVLLGPGGFVACHHPADRVFPATSQREPEQTCQSRSN